MSAQDPSRIAARSVFLAPALFAGLLAGPLLGGCGSTPQCTGGLQPYKDGCLSQTAIEYATCTEGRGFDTSTEVGAGVGGTLRSIVGASLDVAYKKAQQEDTPVALQVVQGCLEVVKMGSAASGPDHSSVIEFQKQAEQDLERWRKEQERRSLGETAEITLSKADVHIGDKIVVTGKQFQANETIEIQFGLDDLTRVTADNNGSFRATVTIPSANPGGIGNEVIATGRTSLRHDRRPVHIIN